MKFGFIAKHRGIWPVAWLCEALGVSRSGFHAWLGRAVAVVFMVGVAASTVGAFIPRAVFMVAFTHSIPRRMPDAVTAHTPDARRPTAIVAGPAFRTASSQAPSRTA